MSLPTDHAGIVALQAIQMKDEMEFRKAPIAKDPVVRLDGLADFIRQHPAEFETKGGIYNGSSEFAAYIKKTDPDPKTLESKLKLVQAALNATLPSFYSGMFDAEMARIFLKNDFDLPTAEVLARSGVMLHEQGDCLQDDRYAAESHHVYDESKAKHPVPFTYHVEDGETNCAEERASRYATLGKIEAKLGKTDEAAASFRKALSQYPNVDATLGMAKIDEARGDKPAALEMYTTGYLSGGLTADNIVEAKALYAALHPGSDANAYEALLDEKYAKTFSNPVKDSAAAPVPAHPKHIVLEELFTGGDCEPCVAPDLATEAALHRYNRDQVVLAVYHNNAPGPDPLTNDTGEARAKYYGTGGSTPHVFLDGKELEIEEGPPSHAQSSFDLLVKAIDPLLAADSDAILSVAGERSGDRVTVSVSGKAPVLPARTHLQILLVETDVSYSGKNTLRFQPMVVRSSAALKGTETGIGVAPGKTLSQTYTFDIKEVEADNFAYYDESRLDLEKRLDHIISSGYMTKAEVDKMAQFREPKNTIHADRLAVIAFLQADDSKKILQTSYATVIDAQAEGTK